VSDEPGEQPLVPRLRAVIAAKDEQIASLTASLETVLAALKGCLTSRADASFELIDAILCAGHAVTSLVQLSLEPEFRRGHGALYDALSAGRIDDERLSALLAEGTAAAC
jgi:hypothetical protein